MGVTSVVFAALNFIAHFLHNEIIEISNEIIAHLFASFYVSRVEARTLIERIFLKIHKHISPHIYCRYVDIFVDIMEQEKLNALIEKL